MLKDDDNATASWNTTDSVIDVTYKGYATTINPKTGIMTALAKTGTSAGGTGNSGGESGNANILPAGAYTVGQEVTLGGEQFFVLEDSGNTVKLLAKYCLNQEGTAQENVNYNTYGRAFSTTNYWSTISGITYPYDLDQTNSPESATVINLAKSYGIAKDATGRLMTRAEVLEIKNGSDLTMKNILFGKWEGQDAPVDGFLYFWTAHVGGSTTAGSVFGSSSNFSARTYSKTDHGVRPVLIVSET